MKCQKFNKEAKIFPHKNLIRPLIVFLVGKEGTLRMSWLKSNYTIPSASTRKLQVKAPSPRLSNSMILARNKTMSNLVKQSESRVSLACVLGGGAYGTAMAQVMARGGTKVQMWARETEVVQAINGQHENIPFLKGKLRYRCQIMS